jgi:hypothetical protein
MMKTSRLLKITLSIAILAFLSTNVLGQVGDISSPNAPGNMIENTGGPNIGTDSVTAGVIVPYYVTPDPVLNDGFTEPYDPTASSNQGFTSTWNWSVTGTLLNDSTQGAGKYGSGGSDNSGTGPYLEVIWDAPAGDPSADPQTLEVTEEGAAGCPGTTSQLTVQVFPAPSFTPVSSSGNQNSNPQIEVCGTQYYDVQMYEITDNWVGTGIMKIMLDITVDSVDASAPFGAGLGAPGNEIRVSTDTVVYYDDGGGPTTPVDANGTAENNVSLFNGGYYVTPVDGRVTRYTFDFGTTDGGISDQVSRKSDYLSVGASDAGDGPGNDQGWTYYDATGNGTDGTTIDLVCYPEPNTGNIYYVPNDFDQ